MRIISKKKSFLNYAYDVLWVYVLYRQVQTCIEPAIDAELKLPLISPFGYDFRYKKLEFDESMDDDDDEPMRDGRCCW